MTRRTPREALDTFRKALEDMEARPYTVRTELRREGGHTYAVTVRTPKR